MPKDFGRPEVLKKLEFFEHGINMGTCRSAVADAS